MRSRSGGWVAAGSLAIAVSLSMALPAAAAKDASIFRPAAAMDDASIFRPAAAMDDASIFRPAADRVTRSWSESWQTTRACIVRVWARCPVGDDSAAAGPKGRSVLTILALGGAIAAVTFAGDGADTARWTSRNGFDDAVRSAFRAKSPAGRNAASAVSDAFLVTLAVGTVADWWWQDRRGRLGFANMATTDTSWILANVLVTQGVKRGAARERPLASSCQANAGYARACRHTGGFDESFFSGHASLGGTLAGLACARHLSTRAVGRADVGVCAGAVGLSLGTGLLRVTADAHWASDVLVGWSSGLVFGYLMPRIVDYRGPAGPFSRIAVVPLVETRSWGAQVAMRF